tara:strand:+ start:634 stop:783 length:150 start_codon:yes stop_codon:yes gene_type:complete
MSETTIEKNNEAENNEFQKIHKRLDEQNKKIDKILKFLIVIGILIIMFN